MSKTRYARKIGFVLGPAVVLTYLLMVMGNFVTSTDSGLACPDWPLCHGSVTPPMDINIWLEWGHRLLGGVATILIILSTVFVWRHHTGVPRYLTGLVMLLMLLGVVMGGVIVLTEAPLLDNFTRIAIVSSHLLISTMVLICLIFTFRYVTAPRVVMDTTYYPLLFSAVYLMVVLGILVRYSGSSLACPDFPLCHGELIPPFWDYAIALHFSHRAFAVAIIVLNIVILYRAIREGNGVTGYLVTFFLVLLQASFGVLIVSTGMFLPVIVLHGATGFLLLAWLAYQSMPYFFPYWPSREATEG